MPVKEKRKKCMKCNQYAINCKLGVQMDETGGGGGGMTVKSPNIIHNTKSEQIVSCFCFSGYVLYHLRHYNFGER